LQLAANPLGYTSLPETASRFSVHTALVALVHLEGCLALGVVAFLLISVVACGGSDQAVEPPLALPPLDPRLRSLTQGSIALDVAPGGRQAIDTQALAMQAGAATACPTLVFLFSWRTQQADGLVFEAKRQDVQFDVGAGPRGQASIGGCSLLAAVNDTSKRVNGELRYIIAEAQPQ
jgi:hypothetical protein